MDYTTAAKSSNSGRLILLDGLRGAAAFAVILDHVPSEFLRSLLPGRYLAVDFFLVLSGLVLARAYGDMLGKPGSTWKFMKIRLIRLYPFYLLGLGMGCAIALFVALRGWSTFSAQEFASSVIMGLLFLPSPATIHTDTQFLFPFNPPAWTLFFELLANFFYALTFRFLSSPVLIVLLLLLGAVSTNAVLSSPDLGPGWTWSHFGAGLARILFTFMLGVMLHRVIHLAKAFTVPAALAVAIFIVVISFPVADSLRRPYDAIAAALFMPALVFVAAHSKAPRSLDRFCAWLGLVSYGVYIVHVPVYSALDIIFNALGIAMPGALKVLLVALVSAMIAHVAGKLLEEKVRAYFMDRFVRHKVD